MPNIPFDLDLSTIARPVLILVCGMLLFNVPTLIYKIGLFWRAIFYLLFCNDKSWKNPADPEMYVGPLLKSGAQLPRKTIYFVRHGESTWNDTFNKGAHRSAIVFAIGFIPGLMKAVLYELYLILSGKMDSWFYDSPISTLGLGQVEQLARFFKRKPATSEEAKHISILLAEPTAPTSKLLCSNLRRAVSTMAAGFRDRLNRRPQEKILIIPDLQEISRNPDALCITPAHTMIQASWVDKTSNVTDFQTIFSHQVDMSLHTGNKPVNTNGLKRMEHFCDFVFSPSVREEFVIVGGHSLWFRSFFKIFLPHSATHVSKQKKIVNGGVVAFDLIKGDGKYMIDPKSIHVVYGGFH